MYVTRDNRGRIGAIDAPGKQTARRVSRRAVMAA
jgi:hypothetical protein